MPLHTVVCVKQVPDTTQVRIDPETGNLVRKGIPSVVNPFDLFAVEAALRLREAHGGSISALSMGPAQAEEALYKVLGYGVDRAFLLSDRAFAGSDTLATTYTLAAAIRKIGASEPVDLVICGKQSIDGDTGQVGPGLARRLGFSQLTYVCSLEDVDPEAGVVRAYRQLEDGRELLEAALPAAITVTEGCNRVRYASLADMIASIDKRITVWSAGDLELESDRIGLKGSPTRVRKIFAPPGRERGEIISDSQKDTAGMARALVDRLAGYGFHPGGRHD